VAHEIGADPALAIAATHGKRAIDNLAHFKPHLYAHNPPAAVDEFERTILFYADAHARAHMRGAAGSSTPSLLSDAGSSSSSGPSSTAASSCVSSLVQSAARCHLWATCGVRGRARDRSERGGGKGAP
jgi:hypothetical protein